MDVAVLERYRDRQDSAIYGSRLIIYRRKGDNVGNFSFRAKIAGRKAYIRRSCGTPDAAEAMVLAHQQYEELLIAHRGGFSLNKLTMDEFFTDWMSKKRHNFTESRAQWKRSVYERYMSGYFGKKNISELDKDFCDGYWDYRKKFWTTKAGQKRMLLNDKRIKAKTKSSHNVAKKPSFATLRAEASLINEFLRAATNANHLAKTITVSAQDAVPKNERGDGYRDTFTDHEWSVLTSNLYNYAQCRGKFADDRTHLLHKFQRRMFHAFVLLGSSTGLRVGELKQLRWSDFRLSKNDHGEDVLIIEVRAATSKVRRSRSAVAHSPHIIRVIDEYKELSSHNKNNDLVFYSEKKNGDISTVDMSTTFKNFLRKCDYEGREEGLRISHDGKARTLYSLRHFYAIQRLKQNVDVFQLATNMGTGVTQIRNHYGRHISGDSFIKELTKFQSKSGEKVKSTAVKKLVDMLESGVIDERLAMDAFKRISELR